MVIIFLPHPSFEESLAVLDDRRLGKQRVEAKQIINALTNPEVKGYKNHPATRMWIGHVDALIKYYNLSIDEWIKRGKNNTMEKMQYIGDGSCSMPWWYKWDHVHKSHQASLVRKHPSFYREKFNVESFYLERGYLWPSHHDPSIRERKEVDLNSLFAPINQTTVRSEEESRKNLYTVVQLRTMCKERGIRGYSGKKKEELLSMLQLS